MAKSGFTSQQVSEIIGVSQRQLGYWRKTELITPTHKTSGGHARYSFSDLVALKAIRQLIDSGVSLQRVRQNIAALLGFLPTLSTPLSELSLVATGDVVLVLYEGSAFEALTGQEWILEIATLEKQAATILDKTEQPFQHALFDDETEAVTKDWRKSGGVATR
jgi:DNA-binding transcriptional MerR regulator